MEIYDENGLKVHLHFGAEFSNVLIISIQHTIKNPNIRQLAFHLDIDPAGLDEVCFVNQNRGRYHFIILETNL